MAIFEPLREGFRELNRLVTDRQTFNAQHEARTQENEMKNTILASQLEDRAFQRASMEKKILMGAEMNEFEKQMAREKFEQAKYQFDTTKDIQTQQLGLAKKNAESSRSFRQKQIQQMDAQLEENLDNNDPRPVSQLIDGSGWRNASTETKNRLAGEVYGALYDENKDAIIDENGDEVKVSKRNQLKLQGRMMGVLSGDLARTQEKNMQRVAEINTNLAALQKQLKFASTSRDGDIRQRPNVVKLRTQAEALKRELAEAEVLAGEVGKETDRNDIIEAKQKAAIQAYRVGDRDAAKVLETEIANIRAEEIAEAKARGAEGSKSKTTREVYALKMDEAGNPIPGSGRLMNVPTSAGTIAMPEGYVSGKEYNILNKSDDDREKMIENEAKDLWGDATGMGGALVIGKENFQLYEGLRTIARELRKSDEEYYAEMTDAEIMAEAKREQADTIQDYFAREERIFQAMPNPSPERKALLEELDQKAADVLGMVPTEKALQRVKKIGLVPESREE